jgi:hypothetical protein
MYGREVLLASERDKLPGNPFLCRTFPALKEFQNQKEKTMNTNRKSTRGAVLALLVVAMVTSFVALGSAQKVKPPVTLAQLAGPWQIGVSGNTGCGVSALLFTGTLNTSGVATGTLTGASTGCASSSNTQTFTITSLNPNGSGTANLSCGYDCGWDFNIQVNASKQIFNLVDVSNGGDNVLAGTAVKQ